LAAGFEAPPTPGEGLGRGSFLKMRIISQNEHLSIKCRFDNQLLFSILPFGIYSGPAFANVPWIKLNQQNKLISLN